MEVGVPEDHGAGGRLEDLGVRAGGSVHSRLSSYPSLVTSDHPILNSHCHFEIEATSARGSLSWGQGALWLLCVRLLCHRSGP